MVVRNQLLAEKFADFFNDKIQQLKRDLNLSSLANLDLSIELPDQQCGEAFTDFTSVSESDIRKAVYHSKSKSCELDPLPTYILKQSIDTLLPIITSIINSSLTSGVFPDSFKMGIVRPVIKKKSLDSEVLSNYRPITNIGFLSKVLERIVAAQTLNHLHRHDLLSKFQSAYRQFYSTETALLRVLNDILVAIDAHQEVVLVLLDLSSAFDTIDHSALIKRLSSRYGLNGRVLDWYTSYLNARSYQVHVKGSQSSPKQLFYGVPQGSVLGPMLFSLFFAPLEDVILKHGFDVMIYADDTQLYIKIKSFDNRSNSLEKFEQCINDVLIWCTLNGLVCNPGKTDIIHLFSKFMKVSTFAGLNIGGSFVQPKCSARNLGVIIDSNLTMTNHINNICKQAYISIRNIGRIRKYLDMESCKKIVHAFITSKIDSCNSLLAGLPDYEISKLQSIQNTAARLVSRCKKDDPIDNILFELHWLPVKYRIDFKILILVYKALHNQAPSYITDLLKQYIPPRSLRSSNKHLLVVPKVYTKAYGDRSFSAYAANLWNSLPLSIKLCDTLVQFKSNAKTFLFQKAFCKYLV